MIPSCWKVSGDHQN